MRPKKISSGYKGPRKRIGIIIPLLLVLIAAAAVALYIINENMTFSLDGATLDRGEEEQSSPAPETNLVVEQPETEKKEEKKEEAPKKEETAPAAAESDDQNAIHAKYISVKEIREPQNLQSLIADSSVNTIVLEVKAPNGLLAFTSGHNIAINANVSEDDAVLKNAVQAVRAAGKKAAFYMSCFCDNIGARQNKAFAVRAKEDKPWLDAEDRRWLSAYSGTAQKYLIEMIQKLKGFSPDMIILGDMTFPATGDTGLCDYDTSLGTKAEQLESFMKDAVAAAGDTELCASSRNYGGKYLKESAENAATTAKYFKTVFVPLEKSEYSAGYDAAKEAYSGTQCKVYPIVKSADGVTGGYILKTE